MKSQAEWAEHVKRPLPAEMARRGITYEELADRESRPSSGWRLSLHRLLQEIATPPDGTVNIAQTPEDRRGKINAQVDGMKETAEIIGVDHVRIGTDQHVSPGSMPDYTQWVRLFAAILGGGFTPEEPERSPAATICVSFAMRSADPSDHHGEGPSPSTKLRRGLIGRQ